MYLEGPRASECGDLSLFGCRPASLQRRGQPFECVSSLSLTWVWLALRHRTCAVSHTEPCAQDGPMLGLMSVVSIMKFLVFFELVFWK